MKNVVRRNNSTPAITENLLIVQKLRKVDTAITLDVRMRRPGRCRQLVLGFAMIFTGQQQPEQHE